MVNAVARAIPVLVLLLFVVGCAPQRTLARRPVQPKRTLDELYALAARVNQSAPPYLLGTGDGIGQRTYDIYVEETVMGRPRH